MKKVVALRNYSDRYIVIREGMIYNLDDSIADSLIEKGVLGLGIPDDISVTPSSTTGTQIADIKVNGQSNKIYAPAGGGDNTMPVSVDTDTGVLNKTFSEIYNAMHSGKIVYIFVDEDGIYWTFVVTKAYRDDSYDPPQYWVETTETFFVADAVDDYPHLPADGG